MEILYLYINIYILMKNYKKKNLKKKKKNLQT